MTQISPMLAVSDAAAAIDFYKRAFDAEELWHIGEPPDVAGLSVQEAQLFLARQTPSRGTVAPDDAGHTTVRIELLVDDPHAVQERAIAAGARAASPVTEHVHKTIGSRSQLRMLQGGVIDPFGHHWLIGKFLD